jgi:TonB-dependent starch-binding outer membrane protein SusC
MKKYLKAVFRTDCILKVPEITKLTAFLMLFTVLQVYAGNTFTLQAQAIKISGTATDEKGGGLPGVSVIIKGTTKGTVTDVNGNFELEVPDKDQVLQFSFIGMVTQEIPVGNQTVINVKMVGDYIGLEDVVVVGYGTQSKANLTGSLAVVSTDNLKVNPKGRVTESLQGAAAGVDVYNSNVPGQDAKIRIHGLGTIGNNDPLWVIDGIPGGRSLNLNPADIESITILKDAASTAIYGARGSNGVILVTTKKGKQNGATQIDFNVRTGFANNYAKLDLLNPTEYGEMLWLQAKNDGIQPNHVQYGNGATPVIPVYVVPSGLATVDESLYNKNTYQISKANPQGTDWYDLLYRPAAKTSEATLSISGGSEKMAYGVGFGYVSEEGVVKYSDYHRYSFNANLISYAKDWLEIGTTIRLGYSDFQGSREQGESGPAAGIATAAALLPVYDIMGNFAPISKVAGFDARVNPLGEIYRDRNRNSGVLELVGNAYANISILKNLNFKSLFGYIIDQDRLIYPLENNYESYQARGFDQLTESLSEYKQFNYTNTLNYTTTLADVHNLQVLLGTESLWRNGRSFSALRNRYFSTDLDYMVLDAGEGLRDNSGSAYDWSLLSFFGRVNYGYDNRYLLDLTFRRDGSSRFGSQNPWGNFASVGAAWRITEEGFMDARPNWLNDLKLRVSWGQSGNDNIGNYNGVSTYRSSVTNTYYPIKGGNVLAPGFALAGFGNPGTKWETTVSKTIGIDAALLNRLSVTLDLWQKDTQDMLYQEVIPAVVGNGTAPSVNVGDMRNRGIDLQLTYRSDAKRDFNYSLTLNLSHYKNELVKLSSKDTEVLRGFTYREFPIVQSEKGQAFPSFFGYDVVGLFQSQDEASGYAPQFGGAYNKAGQFKFRDVNGDGVVDGNDRTYIGNPLPDLVAGLTANLSYKKFQLVANFYSTIGNDMVNLMRRTTDMNFFLSNRSKRRLYESWGSPYLTDNKDAKMPIAQVNDSYSQLPSSYYIEDGSYLRLRNLQIGYDLSDYVKKAAGINRLQIYVSGTDLFTITNYSGLDPQVNASDSGFGVDLGNWPAPRRYTLGVNMSF